MSHTPDLGSGINAEAAPVDSIPRAAEVAKADAFAHPAAPSIDAAGRSGPQSDGKNSAGSFSGLAVSQAPVLLDRVVPSYPEDARQRGVEGQVVLRFIVDQSGTVEPDIEVVASLPMLDRAAIEAVKQWRFLPARDRNGNPVRAQVSVPLQFTLQ